MTRALWLVLGVAAACGSDKEPHVPSEGGVPRDAAAELDAAGVLDAAPDPAADAGVDAGPDLPEACAGIVPAAGTDVTARFVADGFSAPVVVTAPAGDPRLFVVDQAGRIRIVRAGVVLDPPFLDITALVHASGTERGLLGLAFHPAYRDNGAFYVYYTRDGENVVAEVHVSADPDHADPASVVVLLAMPDLQDAHNGGMLAFGPRDGDLYCSTGDDGTSANAPDETVLLGKILRIEVDAAGGYAVPADNPFGNEVFVKGLRNPWRFSFDSATGDLYVGDVGQDLYEEIDWLPDGAIAGVDLGWPDCEGFACGDRPTHTLPVHAYDHGVGNAVIGGTVYRGRALPDLQGTYFFADAYSRHVWAFDAGTAADHLREVDLELDAFLSAFAEDGCGEPYVVDYQGSAVYQIVGG